MACRSRARLAGPLAAGLVLGALVASGCLQSPPPVETDGVAALEADQVLMGAWLGSWPSDDNPTIDRFRATTGVQPDLVDIYLDWSTPVANVTHSLRHVAATGAMPVLTWEAHGLTTVDIAQGTKVLRLRDGRALSSDDYLAEFAAGVCQVADDVEPPVLVRVLHEMNGGWFSWGSSWQDRAGQRPNSDANYTAAWRHIHDAFSSRCGHEVLFVWAVNHFSVGEGASFTGTYPGDDLVDFVGLDGYNWGADAPWGWQGFDTLFHDVYCAVTPLTTRPILIAEVASTEHGGDKAAWIADLYARLDAYPRLRGFVWFDDTKHEVESGTTLTWGLDSSPQALAAYAHGAEALLAQRDPSPPPAGTVPPPDPVGPC